MPSRLTKTLLYFDKDSDADRFIHCTTDRGISKAIFPVESIITCQTANVYPRNNKVSIYFKILSAHKKVSHLQSIAAPVLSFTGDGKQSLYRTYIHFQSFCAVFPIFFATLRDGECLFLRWKFLSVSPAKLFSGFISLLHSESSRAHICVMLFLIVPTNSYCPAHRISSGHAHNMRF